MDYPPIIAGYLATGGAISGAIIQIITIAIDVLIYYPFFKIDDRSKLLAEQNTTTDVDSFNLDDIDL